MSVGKLDLITLHQIDLWIAEQQERANQAEWANVFKFGFGQGLIAIQAKVDSYRKELAK